MEEYKTAFFTGTPLKRFFVYLCNNSFPYNTDPITENATVMLTKNLSLTLSREGVIPFKDVPNLIFPYTEMTYKQKMVLKSILECGHNIVTRLCDCVIVTWPGKSNSTLHRIDQEKVLLCLCDTVLEGGDSARALSLPKRLAMCNIILQRIRSSVQLKHEVFQSLNEYVKNMFPDIPKTFIQKGDHSTEGDHPPYRDASVSHTGAPECNSAKRAKTARE